MHSHLIWWLLYFWNFRFLVFTVFLSRPLPFTCLKCYKMTWDFVYILREERPCSFTWYLQGFVRSGTICFDSRQAFPTRHLCDFRYTWAALKSLVHDTSSLALLLSFLLLIMLLLYFFFTWLIFRAFPRVILLSAPLKSFSKTSSEPHGNLHAFPWGLYHNVFFKNFIN